MDRIEEEILEILLEVNNKKLHLDPDGLENEVDQILAIKVEEDSKCDNCNDGRLSERDSENYVIYEFCPRCKGAGRLSGRTLKQVLEEL